MRAESGARPKGDWGLTRAGYMGPMTHFAGDFHIGGKYVPGPVSVMQQRIGRDFAGGPMGRQHIGPELTAARAIEAEDYWRQIMTRPRQPEEWNWPTNYGPTKPQAHAMGGYAFAARGAVPNFYKPLHAAAQRLTPETIAAGKAWYPQAAAYGAEMALRYGIPVDSARGILAVLSAGTSWESNKTKFERILKAHSEGRPFPYQTTLDAHAKAKAILEGADPWKTARGPKISQFHKGVTGDLSALTLDIWATRTSVAGLPNIPQSMREGVPPKTGPWRVALEKAWARAGREAGLEPAEFQAALWLQEKKESDARKLLARLAARQAPGQVPMFAAMGMRPTKTQAKARHLRRSMNPFVLDGDVRHQFRGLEPFTGEVTRAFETEQGLVPEPEDIDYFDAMARAHGHMAKGGRARGGKYGAAKPAPSASYASYLDQLWGDPRTEPGYAYHQTDSLRGIRLGDWHKPGVQTSGRTSYWTHGGAGLSRPHMSAPGMRLLRTPLDRRFYDDQGNFYGDADLGPVLQTGHVIPRKDLEYWGEDNDWHRFRRGRARAAGGQTFVAPRGRFRQVDPDRFYAAISKAAQVVRPSGRRVGETVSVHSAEAYAKMRTFLGAKGAAGYALTPENDLVSVFNVGGPGYGAGAVKSAVRHGAKTLDAFDEVSPTFAIGKVHPKDLQKNLPNFYAKFGFREYGRQVWNPDYAPEGWQGGEPDVVYMRRGRPKTPRGQLILGMARGGEALEERAIKHFGITDDIREAGYLTPSGKYLDFSGRHEADYKRVGDRWIPRGVRGRDFLAGQRNVDHREAHVLFPRRARKYDFEAAEWLMQSGYARINAPAMSDYLGLSVGHELTPQQVARLRADGRQFGAVDIDISGRHFPYRSKSGGLDLSRGKTLGDYTSGGRRLGELLRQTNEHFGRKAQGGLAAGGPVQAELERLFPNAIVDISPFSQKAQREIALAAGPLAERYPYTAKTIRGLGFDSRTQTQRGAFLVAQMRHSQWDAVPGLGAPYGNRILFQKRAAHLSPEQRSQLKRDLVDSSIGGIFRHEFGHAVDFAHGTSPRYAAAKYELKELSKYAGQRLPLTGAANLSEGFAELFSHVERGEQGAPFGIFKYEALDPISELEHTPDPHEAAWRGGVPMPWTQVLRAQGGPAKKGGLPRGYRMEFYTPDDEMMSASSFAWAEKRQKLFGKPIRKSTEASAATSWAGKPKPMVAAVVTDRKGEVAATAPFTIVGEVGKPGGYLYPELTKVQPGHEGKGLATAMYVKAERFTGKEIHPALGDQTNAGQALWLQKDRPFGKSSQAEVDVIRASLAEDLWVNGPGRDYRGPLPDHWRQPPVPPEEEELEAFRRSREARAAAQSGMLRLGTSNRFVSVPIGRLPMFETDDPIPHRDEGGPVEAELGHYRRRLAGLSHVRAGQGSPEARAQFLIPLLKRMGSVGTVQHELDFAYSLLGQQLKAPKQFSTDETIDAALARLPKVLRERGMSSQYETRELLSRMVDVPSLGPTGGRERDIFMGSHAYDFKPGRGHISDQRAFFRDPHPEMSPFKLPRGAGHPPSDWSRNASGGPVYYGHEGQSYRGMGGYIKPISYGPGFAHKAAGGDAQPGPYIVNENGRELFVPKRLEHVIPPEVMRQIPGGDPWGDERREYDAELTRFARRDRGPRGITEINQRPWSLFTPPEDGWIVPAHLKNKVPRAASGLAGGDPEEPIYDEATGQFLSRRTGKPITARTAAARQKRVARRASENYRYETIAESFAPSLRARESVPPPTDAMRERVAAISNPPITRASPTTAVGAKALFVFGGGRERAAAKVQVTEADDFIKGWRTSLRKQLGREVDPLQHMTSALIKAQDAYSASTAAIGKNAAETKRLGAVQKTFAGDVAHLEEAYKQREEGLAVLEKPQSSLRGLAALQGSFALYQIGLSAVTTAMDLGLKAASPFIDSLSGWSGAALKVGTQLSAQTRELGGATNAAIAGAAGAAGVGVAGGQYLQKNLAPTITAQAGAQAAVEALDLRRAAFFSQTRGFTPGLTGGPTGGLGGSGFGWQVFGGQESFSQTIARGVSEAASSAGRGAPNRTELIARGFSTPAQREQLNVKQAAGLDELNAGLGDFNEAIGRGATYLGQNQSSLQLMTKEQILATGAIKDADWQGIVDQFKAVGAAANDADNANTEAAAGVLLFDKATGKVVQSADEYKQALQQAAQGTLIQSKESFAEQSRLGISASRQMAQAQGELERKLFTPYEFGSQLFQSPTVPGQAAAPLAGLTGKDLTKLFGKAGAAELPGIQVRLAAVQSNAEARMTQAQIDVANMASEISTSISPEAADAFRTSMSDVLRLGQEISAKQVQITQLQSGLHFAEVANNLRLAGRSLKDALGLAGQAGGSRLGGLERQQALIGFNLQQRDINLERAVAGFQVPGETPEERAARQRQVEAKATIQQSLLDIARETFQITATRGVTDASATVRLLHESQRVEAKVIALNAEITDKQADQARAAAKAQSYVTQASKNINSSLELSARYVQQFGGSLKEADDKIRAVLGLPARTTTSGGNSTSGSAKIGIEDNSNYGKQVTPNGYAHTLTAGEVQLELSSGIDQNLNGRLGYASGVLGMTMGPTQFIAGEAQREAVAVIKNPTIGSLGGALGGGGASSPINIVININGAVVRRDDDINNLVRMIEDRLSNRLALAARR